MLYFKVERDEIEVFTFAQCLLSYYQVTVSSASRHLPRVSKQLTVLKTRLPATLCGQKMAINDPLATQK